MVVRKSKKLLWEIMSELEEAGEDDICGLLNLILGAQPNYGTGADLHEYLAALAELQAKGELRLRRYRLEASGAQTSLVGPEENPSAFGSAFAFDAAKGIWIWHDPVRCMVELPEA